MKLDELKDVIDGEICDVNKACEIEDYFVLLRYGYLNFSIHMDITTLRLTSMLFRASIDSETLKMAILEAAELIKAS